MGSVDPVVENSGGTLPVFLRDAARQHPQGLALVEGTVRLTYAELDAAADKLEASFRAMGIGRGDVIAVQLPNWWEAAVVFHAAMRLGCVINPIVTIYRDAEVGFILAQAKAKLILLPDHFRNFDYAAMMGRIRAADVDPIIVLVRCDRPLPPDTLDFEDLLGGEKAEPVHAADPDDVTLLLYTSGTTGEPKGVLHSHRTLINENRAMIEWFGLDVRDNIFMASPVTHITGFLYGILLPPMLGSAVVLQDVWDPAEAFELIADEACRFTVGATPFLRELTDECQRRQAGPGLRYFVCGGADVPPALVENARATTGAQVMRVYGSSECPTVSCGSPTDTVEALADTDGRPMPGIEVRIDGPAGEAGELLVRGPELFLGYFDARLNQDSFDADGFFRTGDLVRIGADGLITVTGRKKDIIIRGGENISAKEIEDLLVRHPKVAEVAIVAMPHARLGETVCAFVVPALPDDPPTLADLLEILTSAGLARQKYPEHLEVVSAMPVTASGKIKKNELRNLIAKEYARN